MSHSLIGADRRTHGKIVAVALACAIGLVMVETMAWRTDMDARAAQARPNGLVIKAGKPAIAADAAAPIIR